MTTIETIERISSKIDKLPLVDSEVVEIITLLNNPASNFKQIVEKVSPSLAARFLNIANSAYYGGREVRNIDYAVKLLGYAKMKDILITSILVDHFTKRLQDFDFDKFLITVATLQNIGKLVIAVYFKDEYRKIVSLKKAERLPSCEAEQQILGMSHGEIGAIVLERFNVPQDICDAVRFHDSLDTELPVQNNNYLQHIARQATRIVGHFSLPQEMAPMDLYHMLRATVEEGKKHYREQVQSQIRSQGYAQIFPSLLEKATDLVSYDLKAHLRERVAGPASTGMGTESCVDGQSE
jgi:HD-like signal output (HDOD) protein